MLMAAARDAGPTGGMELRLTVMPFILRGLSLLGVDSGTSRCPGGSRSGAALPTDLKPANLTQMTQQISLQELPQAFATLLNRACAAGMSSNWARRARL